MCDKPIVRKFPKTTRIVAFAALLLLPSAGFPLEGQHTTAEKASAQSQQIDGLRLTIDIVGPDPHLSNTALKQYAVRAAQTVSLYYGRFPVASARIDISISPGQHGVLQGTTWGDRDGFPALTRLRIGQNTAQPETR